MKLNIRYDWAPSKSRRNHYGLFQLDRLKPGGSIHFAPNDPLFSSVRGAAAAYNKENKKEKTSVHEIKDDKGKIVSRIIYKYAI